MCGGGSVMWVSVGVIEVPDRGGCDVSLSM